MRGTNEEIRTRIERLIKKWRPLLGLEDWMMEFRYDERKEKGCCIATPCYEEATIGFNLNRIRKEMVKPGELEELVVHELVHAIVWKASERSVTQISRALLRARGVKYQ